MVAVILLIEYDNNSANHLSMQALFGILRYYQAKVFISLGVVLLTPAKTVR